MHRHVLHGGQDEFSWAPTRPATWRWASCTGRWPTRPWRGSTACRSACRRPTFRPGARRQVALPFAPQDVAGRPGGRASANDCRSLDLRWCGREDTAPTHNKPRIYGPFPVLTGPALDLNGCTCMEASTAPHCTERKSTPQSAAGPIGTPLGTSDLWDPGPPPEIDPATSPRCPNGDPQPAFMGPYTTRPKSPSHSLRSCSGPRRSETGLCEISSGETTRVRRGQ
jgi:hypothetical protein